MNWVPSQHSPGTCLMLPTKYVSMIKTNAAGERGPGILSRQT